MRNLLSFGVIWLLLLPAGALAQDPVDDPRIAIYGALGFGGDADVSTDPGGSGSEPLDATLGFGVRAELPLHEYFVLGGSFELLTFDTDDGAYSDREEVFDFDALLRVRYPIEISPELWIEPYVMVPFGFSMAVLPRGEGDHVWPGWNTGVLGGAYVVLGDLPLAFFAEIGWRHHQVYSNADVPFIGNVDLKIVTNQFAMQLGAALRL